MINGVSQPFPPRSTSEAERLRSGAKPQPGAATASPFEDSVQLSLGGQGMPAALTAGPPLDSALVDRIGAAIAEGRYPVDPDRIASAMFRDFVEFSG